LAFGIPSIQIDPFQWVLAPSIFFQAIFEEKATLAWLPNFAYNCMANRVREENMQNLELSSIRMFINCGEVVHSESHKKFLLRYQKYGIKKENLAACYAMAEATFALTQTEIAKPVMELSVDSDSLSKGVIRTPKKNSSIRICVSSGKPISGCTLRIAQKDGLDLPEDRVGTIIIKSESLSDGYKNNPEKTKMAFKNGWYITNDLGFRHKGDYFIIGRTDDVIIVAGQNIFLGDIEDQINKIKGVISGRVIAFGIDNQESGTQDICVIAETHLENNQDKCDLELAIKQAGIDIDSTISKVYLVPPRWLIKSSSGKLSRKTNIKRFLIKKGNLV
jgi:acyl-CoA synthetase (AMP-forming)/AMP-acid ligase II